jgi:alpha-ketoglutarate-dependent taurine dioxygenase
MITLTQQRKQQSLSEILSEVGWLHLTEQTETQLTEICDELGETIFTTDVRVNPNSRSMVQSSSGLSFHTDHPKAKYIAWFCHKQSDEGGETLLVDANKVFLQLSAEEQLELHRINCFEHKIFVDDLQYYPLVDSSEGGRKFYFSYWLVNATDKLNPTLLRFRELLENSANIIRLRLQPNDLLIIDNHRIFHSRTKIAGNQDRHLKRLWISQNTFYKQLKSTNMATATLTLPKAVTAERISFLIGKGIDPDIASIDLEMIKMKLGEEKEGIGWTTDQIEDAEIEYKRYLHLTRHFPYPTYSVVPNKIMDTVWHYHILDTRAYHKDCDSVFGHYVHHFPYFGLRGEEDAKELKKQFENTKEYYLQSFGEDLARNREADCWHDCEDRCHNACSKGK